LNLIRLPDTDLNVAPISMGSTAIGSTLDRETSFRLLDAYADAGGNFVDTALVYANWLPIERSISEKTIGAWLHARHNRARIVLSTKGAHPNLDSMHVSRLSPAEIRADLEASLSHLGVETIDIYWLHRDDPARPVEEILTALAGHIQTGKIRYVGCSNWHTARIRAAQDYAHQHGLPAFIGNQMLWSLAAIDPARLADQTLAVMDPEMYRFHRQSGLLAMPYTSQAGGYFSKLDAGQVTSPAGGRVTNPANPYDLPLNQIRLARIRQLSAQTGFSLTQIVLAYLLSQPFVTVPLIGPKTMAHLQDSLTAAAVRLSPDQLTFLEDSPLMS
jgi:aryl-alcohol dehydrogenase-like predicted oxidoreductase